MDKWEMFKNYMHNELGITKDDIRRWIREAAREEAINLANNSFNNFSKELNSHMYDNSFYSNRDIHRDIIDEVAKLLSEHLEIKLRK